MLTTIAAHWTFVQRGVACKPGEVDSNEPDGSFDEDLDGVSLQSEPMAIALALSANDPFFPAEEDDLFIIFWDADLGVLVYGDNGTHTINEVLFAKEVE